MCTKVPILYILDRLYDVKRKTKYSAVNGKSDHDTGVPLVLYSMVYILYTL